ncbi:MAG: FeoB-associated Cys-rich membrane protein [Christensenellales bacterium]
MKIFEILIIVGAVLIVAGVVACGIIRKKKGKSSCCGFCDGCPHCRECGKNTQDGTEDRRA